MFIRAIRLSFCRSRGSANIVKGDTLKSLAKKYGADANEIAEYNGLDPSHSLAVGSTVIIPGGEISAPVPSSSSSSGSQSHSFFNIHSEPYLGGSGAA